ncbi:guanylate kinase family protein [Toxoplasma gondii ARI]|uniref:Guanylate kinase family protein n=1 Tax=Toxoplasma gondii ARI TaxID=1074872 RepID=A0A139XQQ2_TOXGO|nr:guanylate kinase family protein [Toxoplasma gondii ARI]
MSPNISRFLYKTERNRGQRCAIGAVVVLACVTAKVEDAALLMWRVSRFFLPRQVREIETTTRSRPERMQWHCKEIDGSGRFSYSAPRMLAAAADANALSAAATKSRAVAAAAEEERTTAAELLPISSSGGVSPSSANAALREAQRSAGDAAEDAVLEETNDAREVEENGASEAESGCRRATLLKRILRDTAPRILVVAGPSGVGKGTLVKRIFAKWPQVRRLAGKN